MRGRKEKKKKEHVLTKRRWDTDSNSTPRSTQNIAISDKIAYGNSLWYALEDVPLVEFMYLVHTDRQEQRRRMRQRGRQFIK